MANSRKSAQSYILSGNVLIDDRVMDKPGSKVNEDCVIRFKKPVTEEFVSRGGQKLKKALESFAIDVTGLTAMDVGASTGGFTDCLLKMGAKKVYAIDVGYGQMAFKLQKDERVTVIDRTNIRYMKKESIPEEADIAVVDLSFISLKKVLNNIANFVKNKGSIVALIKPQFEVGKENIGKGGIVKDEKEHERVIKDIKTFCEKNNLNVSGVIPSPILGTKGNKEFFIHLNK